MPKLQIAVVVGSLRRDSLNLRLSQALVKLAPADWSLTKLRIDDLPLFNQDEEHTPCEAVKRLKAEVRASQGLLFITPEYNRSVPGVLKNAIDHASRPHGDSAWAGKPAGLMGISLGAIGTAMAQQHLRNVLSCLDMPTLPQPEAYIQLKEGLFDASGGFGPDSQQVMQTWMDRYVAWVHAHTG